jgi:hypothetical protein
LQGVPLQSTDRYTRARSHLAVCPIDLTYFVKPPNGQHYFAIVGNRSSDETGVAPLWNDRTSKLAAGSQHPAHFINRPGSDDGRGMTWTAAQGIDGVSGHQIKFDQHLI